MKRMRERRRARMKVMWRLEGGLLMLKIRARSAMVCV